MTDDAIAWRVERACAAAYPPRAAQRVGDWTVALSDGGSRRSNSASAHMPDAALDPATLTAIAALYADAGRSTIVRVTDLAPRATAALDTAGFESPEGRTRTLCAVPDRTIAPAPGTAITAMAEEGWCGVRRRLAPGVEDSRDVAARLTVPAGYASRREGGQVCAIGYAAIHADVAVIEAIATDPGARRRGHARAIVAALCHWAADHGARHVALQVEETNAPARALYANMGFVTDLYGYHYRRRAAFHSGVAGLGSRQP